MPLRRISRARLIAIVAAAAAIWAAWHFWPDEERRVRRRLDALSEVVNEQPRDGVALVARTAQLAGFLSDDVVLDPGRGAGAIHGRERLLALATRVPSSGGPSRLQFVDVSVEVKDSEAICHLTAMLTLVDPGTTEETVDAREVELTWRKTDDWRISRIVAVSPMETPQP